MVIGSSGLGFLREEVVMLLIGFRDAYFHGSIYPYCLSYLKVALNARVCQFKTLLRPFHSSTGFHKSFSLVLVWAH